MKYYLIIILILITIIYYKIYSYHKGVYNLYCESFYNFENNLSDNEKNILNIV